MRPYRLVYISGWAADERAWSRALEDVGGEVPRTHVPWWNCLTSSPEENSLARCLAEDDRPTVVAAWSLGVLAALPVLAADPPNLLGAVLVAGTARMPADTDYPGADPRTVQAMRIQLARKRATVVEQFAKLCTAPHEDDGFRSEFTRHGESIPTATLQAGLQFLEERDARDEVSRIKAETTVVHGEDDQVVPIENGRWLADNVPAAQFIPVPRVTHAVLHEAPCLVARAIRSAADAE